MAPRVTAAEIESVIRSLTHINFASVVVDKGGAIQEIHALTDTTRVPKQVVRDIESAVKAKFGIELDHKKISVAQSTNGKEKPVGERLKFQDVSIFLNGLSAKAVVRLASNGSTLTGEATGPSSTHSQLRLISNATLKAIEGCGNGDIALVLEDVNPSVNLSGQTIVVVFVNMVTSKGDDFLSGSAVVKQDLWKAVVNATLDAVNRRVGLIGDQ